MMLIYFRRTFSIKGGLEIHYATYVLDKSALYVKELLDALATYIESPGANLSA